MKQQWDTAIHLLEWPKSKALTTPNADKVVDQQNSPSLLVGVQNGIVILEDGLASLTKLNILLLYNLAIVLLGIYPKELKNYVYTKTCTKYL